jgi:hypothetical protein
VTAAVVGLVGLVWILQGLGAPIGGGFMVGDLRWAAAGVVLVVVAGFLLSQRVRRHR